jgi:hypothetical protein
MDGFSQSVRRLLRALRAAEPRRAPIRWGPPTAGAEARAIQFLLSNLSPAQREQFATLRYFDVIGGTTGSRYRIRYGPQMNVEQLDHNGRRRQSLCFVPQGGLPVGDIMLAQKIALELFEEQALSAANRALWAWEYEPRRSRRWSAVLDA